MKFHSSIFCHDNFIKINTGIICRLIIILLKLSICIDGILNIRVILVLQ